MGPRPPMGPCPRQAMPSCSPPLRLEPSVFSFTEGNPEDQRGWCGGQMGSKSPWMGWPPGQRVMPVLPRQVARVGHQARKCPGGGGAKPAAHCRAASWQTVLRSHPCVLILKSEPLHTLWVFWHGAENPRVCQPLFLTGRWMSWLESVPPNTCPPRTSECDLVRKEGLRRCSLLK